MLTVLSLIAPLFSLIALGFVIGRARYLAAGADRILAEFAFKVAMPALLFRATSTFEPLPSSPLSLLAVYFGASLTVWVLASLATTTLLRRPGPDAPVVAMGSCFGNTVMLGIPLALIVFGEAAATPAAIIVAVETPLLWVLATMHAQWSLRGRAGISLAALRDVAVEILRNPIVLSIILGILWRTTGLTMHEGIDSIIALLGQAAVPAALTALGLTLANFRIKGEAGTLATIGIAKLFLFPALVFVFALFADLPPIWAAVALLFAAMPTGANAYLFAARCDRVMNSISGSLIITTIVAALTLSLLLYLSGWSRP
jgi:malonate transporter and related proteins